jgi:hypothetical protein
VGLVERQELSLLATRHIDRLRQAIAAGEQDEALRLLDTVIEGKKGYHDFAVRWTAMLLQRLSDLGGPEAVREAHEEFANTFVPEVVARWRERRKVDPGAPFPLEEFIRQRSIMWDLSHDNVFSWEEDDEKFVLRLEPCESGGRLLFEERYAKSKAEYPWTNGKEFGFYCQHCLVMWENQPKELEGGPRILFSPPRRPGEACVQHFYKRVADANAHAEDFRQHPKQHAGG